MIRGRYFPLIQPDASIPKQALLKLFVLIYLPIVVALSIAVLMSIRLDEQMRVGRAEVREQARIEIAMSLLARDFSTVDSDLHIIASLPLLRQYLVSGSPALRDALARLFRVVAKEQPRYDQIRYLDANGQEVILINYNGGEPAIAPREQLQNKYGRYYFHDTFSLKQGEIYVSPLDPNVEHDQLEIPYKPVVRFSACRCSIAQGVKRV